MPGVSSWETDSPAPNSVYRAPVAGQGRHDVWSLLAARGALRRSAADGLWLPDGDSAGFSNRPFRPTCVLEDRPTNNRADRLSGETPSGPPEHSGVGKAEALPFCCPAFPSGAGCLRGQTENGRSRVVVRIYEQLIRIRAVSKRVPTSSASDVSILFRPHQCKCRVTRQTHLQWWRRGSTALPVHVVRSIARFRTINQSAEAS